MYSSGVTNQNYLRGVQETDARGHSASIANLAATSFSQDKVFSDGVTLELVSITGSVAAGHTANITVSNSV